MGFEPAFAQNADIWPPTGMQMLPVEPDDPRLAIPRNALQIGPRGIGEERYVLTSNAALNQIPVEPLDAGRTAGKTQKSHWWNAAVAGSCVFHAAVALCFLAAYDESASVAGAEQAGIAMLGNAPDDQVSAGEIAEADPTVTNVTLITMFEARPVETATAEPASNARTIEPVETTALATPVVETLTPVEATPAQPEAPAPPAPLTQTDRVEPATQDADATQTMTEVAPEILTTDTIRPVDENVVLKPADTAPEEAFETLANIAPIPKPRPAAPMAEPRKPVEKVETKPAEKKAESAKPREKKKPSKMQGTKKKAGSGGNVEADARRGQADGQVQGKAAAGSKGGKQQTAAGNAAVSNYPGKIVSKLRRALRYPAAAKRQKLRGQVQVSFVVSTGGGVGSIRVVSSSGSPILDKAAVDTVRRAAPFPAIPDGAGRKNWPFTVPLAFTR